MSLESKQSWQCMLELDSRIGKVPKILMSIRKTQRLDWVMEILIATNKDNDSMRYTGMQRVVCV